jgi:hypothetical protein
MLFSFYLPATLSSTLNHKTLPPHYGRFPSISFLLPFKRKIKTTKTLTHAGLGGRIDFHLSFRLWCKKENWETGLGLSFYFRLSIEKDFQTKE